MRTFHPGLRSKFMSNRVRKAILARDSVRHAKRVYKRKIRLERAIEAAKERAFRGSVANLVVDTRSGLAKFFANIREIWLTFIAALGYRAQSSTSFGQLA